MSSIGRTPTPSIRGMWLRFTRAKSAPPIDSRSALASSAPCATMPGPGPWAWAILLTLATTVAWKQTANRRRRLEATSTTTTLMESLLVPPGWSMSPTNPSMTLTALGRRPLTAMPIDEIIDQVTPPDLDSEQLRDPEPQYIASSTHFKDFVRPLHSLFFDDEETVTEEQFGWTLLGMLLSAALGQCQRVTVALITLLLKACPRLRGALRQALGLARILEDAVQEVETEMPVTE